MLTADGCRARRQRFLDRLRPATVTPVGGFPAGFDPGKRWGVAGPVVRPASADPVGYAWSLFPKAENAVVAPRAPAAELLQAACLAGTLRGPLFVLRDGDDPVKGLTELLAARGVKEVIAVVTAAAPCRKLGGVRVTELADAPPAPAQVGIDGALSSNTTVRWTPVDGAAAYRVYWRRADRRDWSDSRLVPATSGTELNLPGVVVDDNFFGVSALSEDGSESIVTFGGLPLVP